MKDEYALSPHFFSAGDSTKVRGFLQIPKLLFTDPRFTKLPLLAKMAYSLYLNRYVDSSYRDEIGKYIIFRDDDIAARLDTTPDYVKKVRGQLRAAGLISYRRSISFNRIYIHSYTQNQPGSDHDAAFFYEDQLDTWRFYRFPSELFDEKYINLPLAAKFMYCMFYDMMCLSQANNFTDSQERIFFKEGIQTQEIKSNFSSHNTVRKYRRYLQAVNLLYEYRPFSEETRFYLLQLDMYEDNVFMFENMTKAEQDDFIDARTKAFKKTFIEKKPSDDTKVIRAAVKATGMTNQKIVDGYQAETGRSLSVGGLRKYLNGSRTMPDEVKSFLVALVQGDPAFSQICHDLSVTYDTGILTNMSPASCQKGDGDAVNKVTSITYTEEKENKDNNIYSPTSEKSRREKEEQQAFFLVSYLRDESLYLTDRDLDFFDDAITDLISHDTFRAGDNTYSRTDINETVQHLLALRKKLELHVIEMINSLRSRSFRSPKAQMHYFEAMLLSGFSTVHEWFDYDVGPIALQKYMSDCYPQEQQVADDIKNLKWWES